MNVYHIKGSIVEETGTNTYHIKGSIVLEGFSPVVSQPNIRKVRHVKWL